MTVQRSRVAALPPPTKSHLSKTHVSYILISLVQEVLGASYLQKGLREQLAD